MSTVSAPLGLATSRPVLIAILAVSAVLALVAAVLFQAPGLLGREKVLTDFDAFYVAGTMADRGEAAKAYKATEMIAAQQAFTGARSFMPWTYPPPFTLFVKGLAQMPIGLAYLLFIGSSFVFYLLVLRRIAGPFLPGVLIAILPTILLTVRTGQNGFLTAGLIGWFLMAFTERRAAAGVPLGLLIIKPHFAAGITLLALMGGRWKAMAIAAGIVAAALAMATAAFGTGIWPAFFHGVREAGQFLKLGYYPLFRMSSVYASVWTFGGSAGLALVLHAIGALAGIGLLIHVWVAKYEPRIIAAAACAASLLVSPYNYDYDLTILGIGTAFVLPGIVGRARKWELTGLLFLSWFATGYGIAMDVVVESSGGGVLTSLETETRLSLAAPALLLLVAGGFVALRRALPAVSVTPPASTDLAA